MTTTSAKVPRLPESIFQHCTHSFEEDSGGVEVFRPDGVSLPPAFGRDGFEMRADGTFIQQGIGPADGIVQVPGRWTSLGPAEILDECVPGTDHLPRRSRVRPRLGRRRDCNRPWSASIGSLANWSTA
jgi:hypothetical protein